MSRTESKWCWAAILFVTLPGSVAGAQDLEEARETKRSVVLAPPFPDDASNNSEMKSKPEATAEAKPKTPTEGQVETRVDAASEVGFLSGNSTLRDSGAFEEIRARARSQFVRGEWRVVVPLSVADRRTVGASLGETRGSLGVRIRYRKTRKLSATLRADLSGRWRGDWLDEYQPIPGGHLGTTDRYSRLRRSFGLEVTSVLNKTDHIRGALKYQLDDYREDPNYNAFDAPTHLVPGDRGVHSLAASWKRWKKKSKFGGGLTLARKESFFAYARDARTGKTHAGRGGPPPNPLQVLIDVEPYGIWEYGRLKDAWQVDLYYGINFVADSFDGYYSSTAHHPKVAYARKLSEKQDFKVGAQIYWRTYGDKSYAATGNRPALRYGDRRVDNKYILDGYFEHRLDEHWGLYAKGKLVVRRTNYPNYVPGVYPSSRTYDILWDYTNIVVAGGVVWKM